MVLFVVLSCGTAPETQEPVSSEPVSSEPVSSAAQQPQQTGSAPAATPSEAVFDPGSISQEKFETAKADVQALINDLNRIIRARNYTAWTGYLADSYFAVISSEAFLEEKTEELYKRDQIVATNLGRDPRMVSKKVLRTPRDYFDNVVVPSRSNDHVDDIDFVSENRVKAYTLDNRGNRLVLYDFEIIDNKWKIIS